MNPSQMQSKAHTPQLTDQAANILWSANADYAQSNDSSVGARERLAARQAAARKVARVLRQTPSNAEALGLMGRIEMDAGNLELAGSLLATARDTAPSDAQHRVNLGYLSLLLEQPRQAEDFFQQALGLDNKLATAFCGIAHARRLQKEFASAFMHYELLLELGYSWHSIHQGMATCMENLSVDSAKPNLIRDALMLLSAKDLPHHRLGHFVAGLIRHTYPADTTAQALLSQALDDALLLLALQKTVMPDPDVETTLARLRRAILETTCETETLGDEMQMLALALACYSARVGYVLPVSDAEYCLLDMVNQGLEQAVYSLGLAELPFGSLIVAAMYGSLLDQPYGNKLAQTVAEDWPSGLAELMQLALFDPLEARRLQKRLKAETADPDKPLHPWPFWQTLSWSDKDSLRRQLDRRFNLSTATLNATLRVAVVGALSGERALELANGYEDVEVIAIEDDMANLAFATRKAREYGLDNIAFWPGSLADRFVAEGHQVHLIEIHDWNTDLLLETRASQWLRGALVKDGLVSINTGHLTAMGRETGLINSIAQQKMKPSAQNLQRLRYMVIENHYQNENSSILKNLDFYGANGCVRQWFQRNEARRTAAIESLSDEREWKLIAAQDKDGQELATSPVLEQLQAQRLGSNVRSLIGHGLSLYFQRRR